MLIKVKRSPDKESRGMDEARYVMRRGMARVADRMRSGDRYQTGVYGEPLRHAKEMSERHSSKQLSAWARGAKRPGISMGK